MKNKSLGSAVISMSYIILGREKNIDYTFYWYPKYDENIYIPIDNKQNHLYY